MHFQHKCPTTKCLHKDNLWWSVVIWGHWIQANLTGNILNAMEKRIVQAAGFQDSLDQRGLPPNPVEDPGDLISCCWTCLSSSLQRRCRHRTQKRHFPRQCPSLSLSSPPPGTERRRSPRPHRADNAVCSPGSLRGEELVIFVEAAAARGNPPPASLMVWLHIYKRAFFFVNYKPLIQKQLLQGALV